MPEGMVKAVAAALLIRAAETVGRDELPPLELPVPEPPEPEGGAFEGVPEDMEGWFEALPPRSDQRELVGQDRTKGKEPLLLVKLYWPERLARPASMCAAYKSKVGVQLRPC